MAAYEFNWKKKFSMNILESGSAAKGMFINEY